MTPLPALPKPTDSELAILCVLWDRGASTVREVHDVLSRNRETVYTSTLKQMQVMAEKGLLRRDESERSHVYTAAVTEERTQKRILKEVVDKAFRGSPGKLVLQALSSRRASDEELAEIRLLLEKMEKGRK